MSRFTSFLLGALVPVVALAAGLVWFVGRGVTALEEPHPLEAAAAHLVRELSTPGWAHDARNPIQATPEVFLEARAHYRDHCAICHGNDGRGDTNLGRGLYPKPPDLTGKHTQGMSDGEVFWIIHAGVRFTGMPAFGDGTPEDDVESWKLVHFLRRLPDLTSEELTELERSEPDPPKHDHGTHHAH